VKRNTLGRTGIEVTPIGLGVLTVGRNQLNLPLAEGAALVRYALERGINFLDTAQFYETYPYIREALRSTPFEPVISSKCLSGSFAAMREAIEEARRALDRDVIDIFLLHEVRHGSDWENRRGAWEALLEAKERGLIRAAGLSTHHVDVAERAAADPEIDVLFSLINYQGLGIRKGGAPGSREEMADAIRRAAEAGKGVFAMKVLGGGNLAGNYLEAMDYACALPGVASAMIGAGRCHEVDRMVEYAEGVIDRAYRPDMSEKRIHVDPGDCEGCGACVERCPNRAIRLAPGGIAEVDPAVCLTCGYCAPICPVRAIILY
jgi:aryl-alcohol dehydrogenase-like predicted oxidoreductase/ferredoxin